MSVLNHFPSSDPASLDQVSHWKPDPLLSTISSASGELFNAGSLKAGVGTQKAVNPAHCREGEWEGERKGTEGRKPGDGREVRWARSFPRMVRTHPAESCPFWA